MTRAFLVPVLLPANPAQPLEAATKQYVDARGFTFTQDTLPSSPAAGATWYDTSVGKAFVYFNDGTSSQWVQY